MKAVTRLALSIFCIVVLATLALTSTAQAENWWNGQWQYRSRIGFDTTPTGADVKSNLADIPVLIRLHMGNFNFSNTGDKGEDIRFVAADDKSLLKHHIEKFDPIDEVAYIWVKVPQLSGGVATDFIWMYFGNKEATGGQDGAGTYDASQVAVYHLGELEGAPRDASAYKNNIADYAGGQGLPSVIGNGMAFSGGGDHLTINAAPSLAFGDGFTFSTWLRIAQPQQAATLLERRGQGESAVRITIDGTQLCFQVTTADGQTFRTAECPDLPLESWHHIALTAQSNQRMAVYLDGLELYYMNLPVALPPADGAIAVAAGLDGQGGYVGDLDELQLANVSRPEDWVRAAFKSQNAEALMVSVGQAEIGGGSGALTKFISTTVQVVRHITVDGWTIIGTLFLMGAACWVIFINKSYGFYLTGKENKSFEAAFAVATDPLAALETLSGYAGSNFFRVYNGGCRVFTEPDGDASGDREGKLKIFKADLEKSYIDESKRLNAGLLMLTMAITGGPFLGLLGTVWGVMSTFAAMAEAGEANIAAIAPGIASALATTVAGLLVAIPALFAYNYLLSRVKAITADLQVFMDQLILKVERIKGGNA